jgi:hypothetical protein
MVTTAHRAGEGDRGRSRESTRTPKVVSTIATALGARDFVIPDEELVFRDDGKGGFEAWRRRRR